MADISTLTINVRWETKPWAHRVLDAAEWLLPRLYGIAPRLTDWLVRPLAWALARWGVRYEVGL